MEQWRLTDREITEINLSGGSVEKAQMAKRQAYIDSGRVILNPDALADLYEACKGLVRVGLLKEWPTYLQGIKNILAKAEGKNG